MPNPSNPPSPVAPGPLQGTVAGRFQIGRLLGVGGMGEVYLADDTRLKRPVALKRLSPGLRHNAKYRQHLQKEAERASALNVQHIAAIYDVIEDKDELLLVMEYVEGATLRHHLPATYDVPKFLELAIQCVEALVAAHEKGVVHRDIKPENIMITPSGQVKVLDYGLAKQLPVVDEHAVTKSSTSASRELSGTWGYMAPEVLLEKPSNGRADIFSLGVVFYEMLSGRSPFLAPSFVLTLDRTLHEDPKPLTEVADGIPPELDRIVAKMLAKSPDERYATARDLAVDLRALQRHIYSGGVFPLPSHRTRWTSLPLRRRRWMTGVAAAAVIALVAGAVLLFRQWNGRPATPAALPAQKLVAVLPFRSIGGGPQDEVYGEGLAETLTAKLTQLTAAHDLQVAPAGEVFSHHVSDVASARRELGVNLVLEGSMHRLGNSVRVTYALVDANTQRQLRADAITADASDPFALEDRVVESVLGLLDVGLKPDEHLALTTYGTKSGGAEDFYLQGRGYLQSYDDPAKVDAAIEIFKRSLLLDPDYARAHAGLGEAYWRKYELTKDPQWVERSRDSCNSAASLDAKLGGAHVCLGTLFNGTGRYEQASAEFSRALELEPTSDSAYRGLALAYNRLDRPADAERTYKRAIDLRPRYFAGYDWLGRFYAQQARYGDSAREFQQAIQLAPDNATLYSSLGGVYLFLGRYDEAIAAFRRSIEIRPTFPAYSNLAMGYFRLHRFTDAAAMFEEAFKLSDATRDYRSAGNLADAYYWDPATRPKSLAVYEEAIRLANEQLKINPRDSEVHMLVAEYYALSGHKAEAYDHINTSLRLRTNDPEGLFTRAIIDTHFGDRDKAIDDVKQAIAHGYSAAEIDRAVELDALRTDPRFQALLTAK